MLYFSGASRSRTGDLWLAKPSSRALVFMVFAKFWQELHEFSETQLGLFTGFMNPNM
jgi:hypothetical protein